VLRTLIILVDDVVGRLDLDLSGVGTVVYLGTHSNRTAKSAGIVLPVAAHVAQDGSFTNKDGRVQRLRRSLHPVGDAAPAYAVLDGLGVALGDAPGTARASGAFAQMAAEIAGMDGMSYASIGDQGQVLGTKSAPAAPTPEQPTA
jgi:predicted molibdopterin-dependent oxidoreductase YjgC